MRRRLILDVLPSVCHVGHIGKNNLDRSAEEILRLREQIVVSDPV